MHPTPSRKSVVNYNPEYDIKEIQARYEAEAKEIREKYEQHIDAHMKMGKVINELEAAVEAEAGRADAAEERFNLCIRDLETERRIRNEYEIKNAQLIEELNSKDHFIQGLTYDGEAMKKDISQMRTEINSLKDENIKMNDFYKTKLRESEDRFHVTVRDIGAENDHLRHELERMRTEFENQLKEIHMENEMFIRKQDEQIRNLSLMNE